MIWQRGKARHLIFAIAVLWLVPASLLAAGAQSLETFLELKAKWPELVGSSFRIEGHYSILGKDRVKLKNCDLLFRSSRPLPRLPGISRVVEVSGRLSKDSDGKLYFELDGIKEMPTDVQTLQQREAALSSRASSKEWFELSKWVIARGKFYEDEELLKRANIINLKGLNLERQEFQEVTPAALRTLAARVSELGLDDSLRADLLHESLWLEWETLRKAALPLDPNADWVPEKDSFFQFLKKMDNELPGAITKQDEVLPLLISEYRKNPVLSYHNAKESSRQIMHRLFHAEVALTAILRIAKPDGSNGDVIAEQIDKQLPEQHELAEKHRDTFLAFETKNSAVLSRAQLQDLVLRCRERKQDTLAKDAIAAWLTRREKSLRKDGVTGLIQLADERIALAQDQTGAGTLLLEALQQTPNNADVLDRLKGMGYQEVNGKWQPPQSIPALPNGVQPPTAETDLDRSIRSGIPSVGMTATQLLRCLGAPSSVTRVVTSGRITETWTYREGVSVRHSATIERRPNRGTALVIAIQ